jgi:hypothetical protein
MLHAMDSSALDTFRAFRSSLYNCFHRRADTLLELTDALLTAEAVPSPLEPTAFSLPWLGQSLYNANSAVDESTPKLCGGCSPTIRLRLEAKRPSLPWT